MQVNPIHVRNFISFEKLPERRYPYGLPHGSFGTQADEQMPEAREDLKAYEGDIDATTALLNLKKAIGEAIPYLNAPLRGIKTTESRIDAQIRDISLPVDRVTNLLACHAQSAYQQDKHDAIWLFNRLMLHPDFDKERGLYIMSDAFRKLDRTFDNIEIMNAEAALKDYYKKQDETSKALIEEIYGNGKNLDFRA